MMRDLVRRYGMNEDRIVREYAAAERRGDVARSSNDYGLDAETYARRLWADALKKGWISGLR